jgi:hypothetical protein
MATTYQLIGIREGAVVAYFNVFVDEAYTERFSGAEAEESQAEFSVLILFIIL